MEPYVMPEKLHGETEMEFLSRVSRDGLYKWEGNLPEGCPCCGLGKRIIERLSRSIMGVENTNFYRCDYCNTYFEWNWLTEEVSEVQTYFPKGILGNRTQKTKLHGVNPAFE